MRRSDALAITLAILATACSGDGPTSVSPGAVPAVSAGAVTSANLVERPIAGRCSATIVSLDFVSPTRAREVVVGQCQIDRLGQSTTYLRQIIDYTTFVGTSEELTFTAANGDILRGSSLTVGTPTSPYTVNLAGRYTFAGGTGRFTHATGSADFTGAADFGAGTASWTLAGHIAYDASDRSAGGG